jgi:hypothetical protein
MPVLQSCAVLGNALFLTRNEQASGANPLAGSLFCADLQNKQG